MSKQGQGTIIPKSIEFFSKVEKKGKDKAKEKGQSSANVLEIMDLQNC